MLNLGVLYYKQGKYKEAEKYARLALEKGLKEAQGLLDEILQLK